MPSARSRRGQVAPPPRPQAGSSRVAAVLAVLAVAILALGALAWSLRPSQASLPPGAGTPAVAATPDPATWMAPGLPMVQRLAAIQRAVELSPMGNRFANDERVAWLQAAGPPADRDGRRNYELRLAYNLLYAGQTQAAIERFRVIEEGLARNPDPNPKLLEEVRMLLAVAWLRLGEQANCIARPSADGCVLPIQGQGVYLYQEGSRQAAALYERILAANPANLTARWMLNIAYMTLGEYPDKVPPDYLVADMVPASEAPGGIARFRDVALEAGLDVFGNAGGALLEDFNNDGALDAVLSSQSLKGPLRFFVNQGDGRFVERTREAGLEGLWGGLNLTQTDYDNDGWLDLVVPRGAWLGEEGRHPNSLLRNNGDGTFTDVTEAAGLLSFHPTQVDASADYDNDGDLDVFFGNESVNPAAVPIAFGQEDAVEHPEHPCQLYRNNGDGTFTEVAAAAGVALVGYVKGAAWGDYDNDGRADLYVSVDGADNRLYHNDGPGADGQWRFTDVTAAAGVAAPRFSFPTWFWDYDHDGWEDLFVGDYGEPKMGRTAEFLAALLGQPTEGNRPYLYRNNGDGTFADVSLALGLDRPTVTMAANFGDLDGDGWLDMYLATGDPWFETLLPNLAYRNDGARRFQDVTAAAGLGHIQKGHGVAFGDYDRDGDEDILGNQGGANSGDGFQKVLFQNPGSGNRWLTLALQGSRANRPAIGARVAVTATTPSGPRTLHRTVGAGSSFGGNSLRLELGLGDATAVPEVSVRWPGGGTERFTGLVLDRAYRLREGAGAPEPLPARP